MTMSNMLPTSTADMAATRWATSSRVVVAVVSWCLLAMAVDVDAQPGARVRLSLLEASVPVQSRSCTLEVAVDATAGEAILTCSRNTPPVSHLGAHRALTTSEAAHLYALASEQVSAQLPRATHAPPASVDRPTAAITITRGTQRVVLDVSDGPNGLSGAAQETWRRLRDIADELRGTGGY